MLSGGRPTGKLHLGHYMGAFKSLADLQNKYDTYFIISDMHMLTTKCKKEHIQSMFENTINMIIDSIGMGMNPKNTTFYLQSQIPELSNIFGFMQNMISAKRVSLTPSLLEMKKHASQSDMTLGLLAYPVLEAADVFALKAKYVPVGKDNIDHIKIAQELVRFINKEYDANFIIPEYITTKNNYVVGIDGSNKMSKSLDNCIYVRDSNDSISQKVQRMPWTPINSDSLNVVMNYLEVFGNNEDKELLIRFKDGDKNLEQTARKALTERLISIVHPMNERMRPFLKDKEEIINLLSSGTEKVRETVRSQQKALHTTMGMIDLFPEGSKLSQNTKKIDFQRDVKTYD